MTDIDAITSEIEDIILEYMKTPALMSKKLKELGNITYFNEPPFGDEKLGQIIFAHINESVPLDTSYIASLVSKFGNFSEILDVYDNDGVSNTFIGEGLYDGFNFDSTLTEPMLISDWANHKHEMVGTFNYPVMEAQEIIDAGRLNELCDTTVISILNHMPEIESVPQGKTNEDLRIYFEEHPSEFISALTDMENIQGPSLEEYLNLVQGTTLEQPVINAILDMPAEFSEFPRLSVEIKNFGETEKGRTYKVLREAGKSYTKAKSNIAESTDEIKNTEEMQELLNKNYEFSEYITPTELSSLLIHSGDIIGREKFVAHEHRPTYNHLVDNGLIYPTEISGEPVNTSSVMVIMMGKPTDEKIDLLKEYKSKIKPGDFMKLAEFTFSEGADVLAIQNLANDINDKSEDGTLPKKSGKEKRYSEKIEIPQGMRPDRNQNHKEG